nr:MAG TPA: hypothetical protein [Bacteriophage sp.]
MYFSLLLPPYLHIFFHTYHFSSLECVTCNISI